LQFAVVLFTPIVVAFLQVAERRNVLNQHGRFENDGTV
jgi:hypothetical protein